MRLADFMSAWGRKPCLKSGGRSERIGARDLSGCNESPGTRSPVLISLFVSVAAIAADPPPLPNVIKPTGVVQTNTVCPPAVFVFTNLSGKVCLETSTNLVAWRRVLEWPSNEYMDITIQIDNPTNRAMYWRLR